MTLLQTYAIKSLADIRTVPRSRHNPQFNTDTLAKALKPENIEYVHLSALHRMLTPFARMEGTQISYPPEQATLL